MHEKYKQWPNKRKNPSKNKTGFISNVFVCLHSHCSNFYFRWFSFWFRIFFLFDGQHTQFTTLLPLFILNEKRETRKKKRVYLSHFYECSKVSKRYQLRFVKINQRANQKQNKQKNKAAAPSTTTAQWIWIAFVETIYVFTHSKHDTFLTSMPMRMVGNLIIFVVYSYIHPKINRFSHYSFVNSPIRKSCSSKYRTTILKKNNRKK